MITCLSTFYNACVYEFCARRGNRVARALLSANKDDDPDLPLLFPLPAWPDRKPPLYPHPSQTRRMGHPPGYPAKGGDMGHLAPGFDDIENFKSLVTPMPNQCVSNLQRLRFYRHEHVFRILRRMPAPPADFLTAERPSTASAQTSSDAYRNVAPEALLTESPDKYPIGLNGYRRNTRVPADSCPPRWHRSCPHAA